MSHRTRPGPMAFSSAVSGAAVLFLLMVPDSGQAAPCTGADAGPGASSATLRDATRCLINRKRRTRGLRALRSRDRLRTAARRHSRDMVRNAFFSHTGSDGSTCVQRIRRTGYLRRATRWAVGEVIAWGTGSRATPRRTVRAWMRSSAHRADILGRFRDVGVGVVRGTPAGGRGLTYTVDFGRK